MRLPCCSESGLALVDQFVASWDSLTHVYVIKIASDGDQGHFAEVNAQSLYDARENLLERWSKQERLLEPLIDSRRELLLYGAGEFSQLIRAYLPTIYARVEKIAVDSTIGARSFDKPVIAIGDIRFKTQQVLIGTNPSTRELVKNKLRGLGVKEANLLTLSV
jgi:hypothetical protein